MKKIFVLFLGISMVLSADLSRSSDGVVSDDITHLQWQDDYGDNGDTVTLDDWEAAIDYCEQLNLGGHEDWRLPNYFELRSIVDYSKIFPAIDESIFKNTEQNFYWSSTTNVMAKDSALIITFGYGYSGANGKKNNHHIRCVRDSE